MSSSFQGVLDKKLKDELCAPECKILNKLGYAIDSCTKYGHSQNREVNAIWPRVTNESEVDWPCILTTPQCRGYWMFPTNSIEPCRSQCDRVGHENAIVCGRNWMYWTEVNSVPQRQALYHFVDSPNDSEVFQQYITIPQADWDQFDSEKCERGREIGVHPINCFEMITGSDALHGATRMIPEGMIDERPFACVRDNEACNSWINDGIKKLECQQNCSFPETGVNFFKRQNVIKMSFTAARTNDMIIGAHRDDAVPYDMSILPNETMSLKEVSLRRSFFARHHTDVFIPNYIVHEVGRRESKANSYPVDLQKDGSRLFYDIARAVTADDASVGHGRSTAAFMGFGVAIFAIVIMAMIAFSRRTKSAKNKKFGSEKSYVCNLESPPTVVDTTITS